MKEPLVLAVAALVLDAADVAFAGPNTEGCGSNVYVAFQTPLGIHCAKATCPDSHCLPKRLDNFTWICDCPSDPRGQISPDYYNASSFGCCSYNFSVDAGPSRVSAIQRPKGESIRLGARGFVPTLALLVAVALVVPVALADDVVVDPCEEDPDLCLKCIPAVAMTPTGQTCTRGCEETSCPTWHNCVFYTEGGCMEHNVVQACTDDTVSQIFLFISDCITYDDCPDPGETRCDWVPTPEICGQQVFNTCH